MTTPKKCKRMQVYSMGRNDAQGIVSTRNGNITWVGCTNTPGKCGCIHAEANLIKKMPNPDLVVLSHSPCLECAHLLHDAGVKVVYYIDKYRLPEGVEYLLECGISVYQMTLSGPVKEEIQ